MLNIRLLTSVLLLVAAPMMAQESLPPTGTNADDNNTSCDTDFHLTVDDDPDSPDGNVLCSAGADCDGWCAADNNNTDWAAMLTFTPTISLDNGTDAQAMEFYVKNFDEGQTGDPTIRVDIYDGVSCADLHETGTETTLTDAGFPIKVVDSWTAAGISAAGDVCVDIVCTHVGGSPGTRNSCDIDAIRWEAAESVGGVAQDMWVIGQ